MTDIVVPGVSPAEALLDKRRAARADLLARRRPGAGRRVVLRLRRQAVVEARRAQLRGGGS
jgi:hypothetical protein